MIFLNEIAHQLHTAPTPHCERTVLLITVNPDKEMLILMTA
jgi:hypothetical protein